MIGNVCNKAASLIEIALSCSGCPNRPFPIPVHSVVIVGDGSSHFILPYTLPKDLPVSLRWQSKTNSSPIVNGNRLYIGCDDGLKAININNHKVAWEYDCKGVESTPFEIFKMLGEGFSRKANHYRFKNKVLKTSKYKVDDIPQIGWDFPVELLYPMVEGPAIKPFTFDWGNNYHLIPYKREDTSKPISLDELTKENPEVAVYFCNHRFLLDQQSDKSKTKR